MVSVSFTVIDLSAISGEDVCRSEEESAIGDGVAITSTGATALPSSVFLPWQETMKAQTANNKIFNRLFILINLP
ncbi:hypothetical protein [Rufibacter glacialis]|uniref:Uncharacterized protein n=1 Tax=Rufibacter glacialis TaxID=1259555 RepID=A0A5M8QP90_9BACT|nr:hypothetical protein [Rufibacter glacialis]KAA6437975.1 hypothetical protein FOE74_00935 [Rufibacter glacialis]